MQLIETVKIKHPDGAGFMIINKADFDPVTHQLYIEAEAKKDPVREPEKVKEDLTSLSRAQLIERLEAAGGSLAEVKGTGKNGAVKNEDLVKAIGEAEAKKATQE